MSMTSLARRTLVLAPVAAAALALAACSGATPDDSAGQSSASEPQSGGDLTIVGNGDLTCLDPWQTTSRTTLQWHRQLGDSLLFEDREGAFHPWLAESYEVSDDATEFRFTLRDDVVFSDGSLLDAETVSANFDALAADPSYTIARGFLAAYEGSVAEDESTVVVSFSAPNAPFLYGVSTPNMSINSMPSTQLGAAERCAGAYSGSGPFVMGDIRPGEQVVIERNADYAWAPESLSNQGPAYLETITVNLVMDPMIVGQSAVSGDAHVANGAHDSLRTQLESEGWTRSTQPDPGGTPSFISYPGRGIMGTDEAVRRAFGLAIDREEMIAVGARDMLPPVGALTQSHPFASDHSELITHDPEAAIELLEDAGWELGDDGIRERDGQRLSIETVHFSLPPGGDMVAVAAQQLAEVGIELTMRPATFAEELALRSEGQIELRLSGQTGAEPTVLPIMFDGNLPEGAAPLVAAQAATVDFDERLAVVDELNTMLLEEGWLTPVYQVSIQPWVARGVNGYLLDVAGLPMLSQVWLDSAS